MVDWGWGQIIELGRSTERPDASGDLAIGARRSPATGARRSPAIGAPPPSLHRRPGRSRDSDRRIWRHSMNRRLNLDTTPRVVAAAAALFLPLVHLFATESAHATSDVWQMKQRDIWKTGRAEFAVPAARMNAGFFSSILWQRHTPWTPTDGGGFSGGSMPFFDGAGPQGADIVVSGYHWPKGVQGMDRHSGKLFWTGLPSGGELIGLSTPAFSNDGSVIYIVNDSTQSGTHPNGHPLMAFHTINGPHPFWHNGANPGPENLGTLSPTVAPDGRIFGSGWNDRPYAATDTGSELVQIWAAETYNHVCFSAVAIHDDGDATIVVAGGRDGWVAAYDGATGAEVWRTHAGGMVDASVTIDPVSGNIFVGAGAGSIRVAGLDLQGNPLWSEVSFPVYDHVPNQNHPERAQSGGCLSHDGQTYYFQTNGPAGNGRLYAIDTIDGSVNWIFETGSTGWELHSSSPIVTPNGVVIVGNNLGGTYFAIRDAGTSGELLATFAVAEGGNAQASATLASDGKLYLPLRTYWLASNGDGHAPTGELGNFYTAFDLRADAAQPQLPPPPRQRAFIGNGIVRLQWSETPDPFGILSHYLVYRSTSPFTSVEGMTPIAIVAKGGLGSYLDATAQNGVTYYYAVTAVTVFGTEIVAVASIGPRTPRDETDLQVVSIARTPLYPRYHPAYTAYEIVEPSGFGPYIFTAATGLLGGQDATTQRWPEVGDKVTYLATIRNRGTNPWNAPLGFEWRIDGVPVHAGSATLVLAPGATTTLALQVPWDGSDAEIAFSLDAKDARPGNDTAAIRARSVAFLSFVDETYVEEFRESTAGYPAATTDDMIDWLTAHMDRFNELFAAAGSPKRVHFGLLEVLPDDAPDPAVETIRYAVFPFRYRADEGSLRLSGYYSPSDDIDYGLLHEMGHQLGLVDLYRLNLPASANQVSGDGYNAVACLMNGVSPFLSAHSAQAMTHWFETAHGYYGQYLYRMPQTVRVQVIGSGGAPVEGATVRLYQKVERPGMGEVLTDQVKAAGTTDEEGVFILPNVPIDQSLVPPTFAGDALGDNPFGYVAVVGTNGLLLVEMELDGFIEHAWLDIVAVNMAYAQGHTEVATFTFETALGGTPQAVPPIDMAEGNASHWSAWADGASYWLEDDFTNTVVGKASIRAETDGGFDTYVRYPGAFPARWNIEPYHTFRFWAYAENSNIGFQERSPWIRLRSPGGFIDIKPQWDILNQAIGNWVLFEIPLAGDGFWERTVAGSPDETAISSVEIHADTWDYGFTLWLDGVGFHPTLALGDLNGDGVVNGADLGMLLFAWGACDPKSPCPADLNGDGVVNGVDLAVLLFNWG
jgi:outer membrane protein assembly factor BamB